MKNIFSERKTLSRFVQGRTLFVFDYDGTLCPITPRPPQAQIPPSTRKLFIQLARIRPCAVVSGRRRGNVLSKLKGIPLVAVVGNHGMEWSPPLFSAKRFVKTVHLWKKILTPVLEQISGVEVEDKRFSLSVHYRHAKPGAKGVIHEALVAIADAEVMEGKKVYNVLPCGAWHKGDAIRELQKKLKFKHVLFVGDDVTDENAFALGLKNGVLGIRVGRSQRSRAPFFIPHQKSIDRLLAYLISNDGLIIP